MSTHFVYFSPTGGTEKVGKRICSFFSDAPSEYDLSAKHVEGGTFPAEDIVVVAVPVFSGRVPEKAATGLRKFEANGAKTISVVVYGNRAFEDTLVELNDVLEEQGFHVVASGAFIAQHSIIESVAANRPDERDTAFIDDFAAAIRKKLDAGDTLEATPVAVPGNRPYRERLTPPRAPLTSSACTRCGLCAEICPTGAISPEHPDETDVDTCIVCMRCIRRCPNAARAMYEKFNRHVENFLREVAADRKENEMFL